MRILFTTPYSRNLVNLNVVYSLEQEVAKTTECRWTGERYPDHRPGESIDQTVKRLYGNDPPDWVVINNAHRPTYKKMVENEGKREYKIAITLADLHVDPPHWVRVANKSDAVLMRYMYSPYIKKSLFGRFNSYTKHDPNYYLNNITKPILHFPWFTDPDIYKPCQEKTYDVIFLGSHRKKVYPLRYDIVKNLGKLCEEKGWKHLVRDRPPGDTLHRDIETLKQQGHIVGDLYAETVAKSSVFIFGNSIFNYPLSKYFEITGSGTLAMADEPTTAEQLSFKSDENYAMINLKSWRERLEYYLDDEQLMEKVAQRGYENAVKHHSIQVRAKQLLGFLKKNM